MERPAVVVDGSKNKVRRRRGLRLLTIFSQLWSFRVGEMAEFVRIAESGMSSEFAKLGEWFDKQTQGMNQGQVSEFIDWYYDDLAMVRDVAPQMLRRAQYLCIVGIYEYEVAALCRFLHGEGKATSSPPKNLYLHCAEAFLHDKARFPRKAFGRDWKFMLRARYPRNAIAHNNGQVRSDGPGRKAKDFIWKHPNLALDNRSRIIIKPGFCQHLIAHMKAAMAALLSEAKTKY